MPISQEKKAPKAYRIQRGPLAGSYRTVYSTNSKAAAWQAYYKTIIGKGEKKRIQRNGKTMRRVRYYWT